MPKPQYKTEWLNGGEPIPSSWLRQTSKWLYNLKSPDGSILISHHAEGINLTLGGYGRSGGVGTSGTPVDGRYSVTRIHEGAAATVYMQLVNDVAATANGKRVYGISAETPPAKRWLTFSPTGVQVVIDNDYSATTGQLRKKLATMRADVTGTTVLLTCTAGTWTVFETAAATCT